MTSNDSTGGNVNFSKPVIVAITAVIIAVIGAQTAIIIAGRDSASLGDLLTQVGTIVAALAGAGSLAAASSAARSSAAAQQQTNGSLDARINDAVARGNDAQLQQMSDIVHRVMRAYLAAATVPAAAPPAPPGPPIDHSV